MTLDRPGGDELSPEEILAVTERHFQRLLEMVDGVAEKVRQGDHAAVKDLQGLARDLHRSSQTLFDERAKVDKLRKQIAGVVHDYALDFDTARVEIGRRLACLRDAGGSGGVSE